jgi:flagellar basal-body rod modification protein FlgD
MDLQSVLSAKEKTDFAQEANLFNKKISDGKAKTGQNLGRDDFLKILITQLSYQDPTAPMEDKEFIAQMAQFSSLEQMTSMAGDFAKLTSMLSGNEAQSSLGKNVEIIMGDSVIQGTVNAVSRGPTPQVLVNGTYYHWDQVSQVFAR